MINLTTSLAVARLRISYNQREHTAQAEIFHHDFIEAGQELFPYQSGLKSHQDAHKILACNGIKVVSCSGYLTPAWRHQPCDRLSPNGQSRSLDLKLSFEAIFELSFEENKIKIEQQRLQAKLIGIDNYEYAANNKGSWPPDLPLADWSEILGEISYRPQSDQISEFDQARYARFHDDTHKLITEQGLTISSCNGYLIGQTIHACQFYPSAPQSNPASQQLILNNRAVSRTTYSPSLSGQNFPLKVNWVEQPPLFEDQTDVKKHLEVFSWFYGFGSTTN